MEKKILGKRNLEVRVHGYQSGGSPLVRSGTCWFLLVGIPISTFSDNLDTVTPVQQVQDIAVHSYRSYCASQFRYLDLMTQYW